MRGKRDNQGKMFFTIDVEARVRADHPLRSLKRIVDRHLHSLQERFEAAYARTGRPSVPPERLGLDQELSPDRQPRSPKVIASANAAAKRSKNVLAG